MQVLHGISPYVGGMPPALANTSEASLVAYESPRCVARWEDHVLQAQCVARQCVDGGKAPERAARVGGQCGGWLGQVCLRPIGRDDVPCCGSATHPARTHKLSEFHA
jgi:hypothetical protein